MEKKFAGPKQNYQVWCDHKFNTSGMPRKKSPHAKILNCSQPAANVNDRQNLQIVR